MSGLARSATLTNYAEVARKDIRLESIEAIARERRQREINPVLRGQSLGHEVAPYSSVLTGTTRKV